MGLGKGRLPFASRRNIVSALQDAGVTGRGEMAKALLSSGAMGLASNGGLFATQVATGNGLVGAGASLSAIGTGAMAATAGITSLVGALGWVAYKTWRIKEAKDAVLEEIVSNEKYRYPSIDALNLSLSETYKKAIDARKEVEKLTGEKTIEDASGHKIGAFNGKWWSAMLSVMGSAGKARNGVYESPSYSFHDARQDESREAIRVIARRDSQARINSAFAQLGKARNAIEIGAFIENISSQFGQEEKSLDKSLFTIDKNGVANYTKGVEKLSESDAYKLYDYFQYMNMEVVPEIRRFANKYQEILSSSSMAENYLSDAGFNYPLLSSSGFTKNENGEWHQQPLGQDATDQQRVKQLANYQEIHDKVVKFTSALRETWGGSAEIAENIMRKAGFSPELFSNEPDLADPEPFNANGITFNDGSPDDNSAGGNYSKAGNSSSSSVAPKQVVVNITNLLSVEAIQLLDSEKGNSEKIQNLKEMMAQALIDVVHDFDISWNG